MVVVSGPVPRLPKRDVKKDPKVCGTTARDSEQLLVSSSGGLKNMIVIVEDVKRGKDVPSSLLNSQIDQKNCEYAPHVMVMPVNAEVAILNSDPILHNIHFYQDDESVSNIAQPVQNHTHKQKLTKKGMVYAECDVHGWMQGHIAVVNNPYVAVTDESGKFSISDLPAGNYKVKFWHEYLGETTLEASVNAKVDTPLNLDLKDLLAAKKPAEAKPAASPDKKIAGPEVVVKMITEGSSFRFEPAEITVKAGTRVKWVNDSENRHTSTADHKLEKKPGQAVVPAGAAIWASPFLAKDESFTQTFTTPGKYQYFCRNHGQFGMEASITVIP